MAVTGTETDLSIVGLAASGTNSAPSQIILRQKASGGNPPSPALATLNAPVFAQQTIYFDVFYASDNRVAASALPANTPTGAQIAAEMNATFNPQANVTFIFNKSFVVNNRYGAFTTDGGLYADQTNSADIPFWQECISPSYDDDSTKTVYRIFVVNKIVADPAAIGFTPSPEADGALPYSFVNANANIRTFSHEAGRALQIPAVFPSTPQAGGPFDVGPWPMEFQDDGLSDQNQQGLMNDNSGTQERWIRQQDWKASNTNASTALFH